MNDHTNSSATSIPEVGLTEIEGQPRARDIDIGERLGFERPRNIRQLIERNLGELQTFGTCCTVQHVVRGNPVTEYWLNEEQVLLVSALSNASNAPAVRSMLIRVFVAWRRGHLVGGAALTPEQAEWLRSAQGMIRQMNHRDVETAKALASLSATVTMLSTIVQPRTPILVRHGKTAGEIWRDHGFPRIKITCWFSNRLIEQGCLMEGKAEVGGRAIRLFDPDKADTWLRNGGRLLVEQKIAERRGQGKLRLIQSVTEDRPNA